MGGGMGGGMAGFPGCPVPGGRGGGGGGGRDAGPPTAGRSTVARPTEAPSTRARWTRSPRRGPRRPARPCPRCRRSPRRRGRPPRRPLRPRPSRRLRPPARARFRCRRRPPSHPRPSCRPGPLGAWDMDDCNSFRTDLRDISFNGFTAFRSVTADLRRGRRGPGRHACPTRRTWSTSPTSRSSPSATGVTVAAWLKPADLGGKQTIFRKRDGLTSSLALMTVGKWYVFVISRQDDEPAAVVGPRAGRRVDPRGRHLRRLLPAPLPQRRGGRPHHRPRPHRGRRGAAADRQRHVPPALRGDASTRSGSTPSPPRRRSSAACSACATRPS